MNIIEIQSEAIIEIVGTKYEGRANNHNGLSFRQKLKLMRKPDNEHDSNAIMVLTAEGREIIEALNRARLTHKLLEISKDLIEKHNITPTSLVVGVGEVIDFQIPDEVLRRMI